MLNRRVRTLLAEGWTKIGTPPAREAKNTAAPEHFWKTQLEKMARRLRAKRIWKSKVANTPCSEYFWKMQLKKMARRLRAKHIWKSKP